MAKLHHLARLSIVPLGLALVFSIILLALPLLSAPRGPGRAQQIGWQSWDIVRYTKPKSAASEASTTEGDDLAGFLDDAWDDEFAPSLPLDTWDPLKRHTTGITEIAAVPCMLPPWIYPSMCGPKTTPQEDKTLGKWVRVERDLNWKTGLWYLVSTLNPDSTPLLTRAERLLPAYKTIRCPAHHGPSPPTRRRSSTMGRKPHPIHTGKG